MLKTQIGQEIAERLATQSDMVQRRMIALEISERFNFACSYDERHELEALRIEALMKPKR